MADAGAKARDGQGNAHETRSNMTLEEADGGCAHACEDRELKHCRLLSLAPYIVLASEQPAKGPIGGNVLPRLRTP